jgi:ubiquinone biosynthesis protein
VDWSCTAQRVLTLERVSGLRVDDLDGLARVGLEPDRILAITATALFHQVFCDGFFHADPHPGNIFVEDTGGVAVVDFGIMGRLDEKTRIHLAEILMGLLEGDYTQVADLHFRAGYVPASQSREDFAQACRAICEPILDLPLHEISIARLLSQLFQATEKFEMEVQPQLLLLQKTLLVAEGVGRSLNPRVNMWQMTRPLIEDWVREHHSVEGRLRSAADELLSLAERLPELLRTVEDVFAGIARNITKNGLKLHPDTVRHMAQDMETPSGGSDNHSDGRSDNRSPGCSDGGDFTAGLITGIALAGIAAAAALAYFTLM